jgi:hypothetical protein
MVVKKRKPTSAGRRFQTVSDFAEITDSKPEKSLIAKKSKTGGRNTNGRVTSRHRGGGHKQRYRVIDFRRDKDGIPARVASIQYDPNRNARIALLNYADGEKRYILAIAPQADGAAEIQRQDPEAAERPERQRDEQHGAHPDSTRPPQVAERLAQDEAHHAPPSSFTSTPCSIRSVRRPS